MVARVSHWPREVGGLACICGWSAATPAMLYRHMLDWMPAMQAISFRAKPTPEGFRRCVQVPGHEMVIKPRVESGTLAIHCACGMNDVLLPRSKPGDVTRRARLHVRRVVAVRCGYTGDVGEYG